MLKRDIKRWDLFLLMINSIIGAGIFGLPSKIFAQAGVYSIAAIFICSLLMLVIIFNFAEVASRFSKTGGPYLYTLEAFGKFPGYIIGWIALVSRITAYAALVNLIVDYLSYLNDAFINQWVRSLTIILITVFLFTVNYQGVKKTSGLNNLLAVAKILPLTIFIIAGFFFIDTDLLNFVDAKPAMADFSSAIFVLVFAFTGFEAALINTGEMSRPGKDIPFALIGATLFVALFYMLIQVVSVGTYPGLGDSIKPIADAADFFMGSAGGLLITVGAVISIGGTLNANLLAGSRIPYALSEENQFPKLFYKTSSKTAIPYVSLIIYTTVTVIVSLTGTFVYAMSINVITKVFLFLIVCAALIKFRKSYGVSETGFTLRYGYVFAVAGIVLSIWLLYVADLSDFVDVVITIVVGIVLYVVYIISKKRFN